MATKRSGTLDSFFKPPPAKKARVDDDNANKTNDEVANDEEPKEYSNHPTYPFPLPHLPPSLDSTLSFAPAKEPRAITNAPDLDLLYYQPYIPPSATRPLFDHLRTHLFFYRVQYPIKRGPTETQINTPRYTTVFGLDATSAFTPDGDLIDASTKTPVPKNTYKCQPRPIPQCLDRLRVLTENATGCKFNFALVNYYASGADSISYHSDDERFLGPEPAIASFTLGARRDFLLRHKKTPAGHASESQPIKLPLGSGDLVLMRGRTQGCWEHSIPKRKGGEAERGRMNITFRRAMVKGGTENYYRYNVGDGGVLKWDGRQGGMVPWVKEGREVKEEESEEKGKG